MVPDAPPYLRLHGVLEPQADFPSLTSSQIESITQLLTRSVNTTPLVKTGALDGAITSPSGSRFRYNIFQAQNRHSMAIRKLEDRFRSLPELGLNEDLYDLCQLPDGLVLVAGPTGSGKSTTIATLLDRINQTRQSHLVTIEDPIEYIYRPIKSLVNQRQVGTDASSFHEALVAALRQDPDVILVGEIRELPTIRTAITAAETGHLVFSTVHAGDCVGAIERLVSVFPAEEQVGIRRQLSLVLRKVITQHLLVADGHASKTTENQRRPRIVTSEVLTVNSAVANLIATGKSSQIYSAMEAGSAYGMQTLEQDLARLWVSGKISEQTALGMSRNPAVVQGRATRLRQGNSNRYPSGARR